MLPSHPGFPAYDRASLRRTQIVKTLTQQNTQVAKGQNRTRRKLFNRISGNRPQPRLTQLVALLCKPWICSATCELSLPRGTEHKAEMNAVLIPASICSRIVCVECRNNAGKLWVLDDNILEVATYRRAMPVTPPFFPSPSRITLRSA